VKQSSGSYGVLPRQSQRGKGASESAVLKAT